MNTVTQKPRVLSNGEGESFQMLSHTLTNKVSAEDTNGGWVMYEVTDTAGHGAPFHTHPWEETFYILEGELEIQVGSRKLSATPGASVYLPANIAHGFTICSPTARFLIILPAHSDKFYREMGEKVSSFPPDMEVLQEVCSKHEVRLFV